MRSKLLRLHAGASELRQLARRFTVAYSEQGADLFFSARAASAVLRVSCADLAAAPLRAAPLLLALRLADPAAAPRLRALVERGYSGFGGLTALCEALAKEMASL